MAVDEERPLASGRFFVLGAVLAVGDEEDRELGAPEDFLGDAAGVLAGVVGELAGGHGDRVGAQVERGAEDLVDGVAADDGSLKPAR